MYVIEVAPLRHGVPLSSLTYFSGEWYGRGTIVSIPIRNSLTPGVILSVTEASATKTALRAATFSLRKLPPQKHTDALSSELISVADELSHYYACSMGAVLFSLLPNEIKKGILPILPYQEYTLPYSFEFQVFEDTKQRRHTEYQSLIRERFAATQSVHIVAPTLVDIDILITNLSAGIEKHVVILKSGLSPKKLTEAWKMVHDFSHPKLIITTPQYGFIERGDIRTVILERSRAAGYRSQRKPYIDYRNAYLTHAKKCNRHIILGDIVVRSEEIQAIKDERAEPYHTLQKRLVLPSKLDTILITHKPDSNAPFKLFSDKALSAVRATIESKGSAFLFAARRGLAPVVACVDCGHVLRAPESGAPLSLHRTMKNGVEERWLVCSVSGYRERARDLCPQCGSWRLKERGIGIQQMYDVLKNEIPHDRITLFDHTTAKTHTKACELIKNFYTTKGGVLLGTALALPYMEKPITTSIVTSMDALRAIPSWRQQEETFSILMSIREKTNHSVLVQTRTTDTDILDLVEKGSVLDFHEEELQIREQFQYPPKTVFVHLSWQGTREAVKKVDDDIQTLFGTHNVTTYTSMQPGAQNDEKVLRQALIRIPAQDWPHTEIVEKIRSLSPNIRVIINPDRVV